jgi:sugar lactone lactonase YvrE
MTTLRIGIALAIFALGTGTAADDRAVIETVAGGGPVGDGGLATKARLSLPGGLLVTQRGDLLVVDFGNHRIRRVDARTGIISTVAGTGETGFTGDGGPARLATLSRPENAALDADDNVIIVDEYNHRIRRVDARTGIITTIAGDGHKGFAGDGGPALEARFDQPEGIAADSAGNLYIGDTQNNRVRRIDAATGIVTTFAGSGAFGVSPDGTDRLKAKFLRIARLAVDRRGNVYIADSPAHKIIMVDAAAGTIRSIAGNGIDGYAGDGGPATRAHLSYPEGVLVDASGDVYFCDVGTHHVRKVSARSGIITTVAGNGEKGFSPDDVPAIESRLWSPGRLAIDQDGGLLIADIGNARVRRVDRATGLMRTVAGSGDIGDGGLARDAIMAVPGDVVYYHDQLYVADYGNRRVRRVDLHTHTITTVAGGGTAQGGGASATASELLLPEGLAIDARGNLFIADNLANRIWVVDAKSGVLRVVAGRGEPGYSGDGGPPEEARLKLPGAVAAAPDGTVYIADYGNQRIRVVDPGGKAIHTLTWTEGEPFREMAVVSLTATTDQLFFLLAGDSALYTFDLRSKRASRVPVSLAYRSEESRLMDLAIDGRDLLVADTLAHRVFRLDPRSGSTVLVAGNGVQAFSGDGGRASAAALFQPGGVAAGSRGELFIADTKNHRIRRVFSAASVSQR